MGDPFSITASVLTVLQVADSLITFIRDLKNASEEHRRVLAEVHGLRNVLHEVEKSSIRAAKKMIQGDHFASLQEPLEICHMHLDDLKMTLAPMQGSGRARSSMMWKFKRPEIKNILADIERQKTALMMALQIETKFVLT